MFRTIGKSKIAFVLAILFGISLFFFRGGSKYSNIFNSDNVIANVSGTPISTTKFNRTLKMNINQFNQMLGKTMSSEEIKTFQVHTLALGALINNAVFENEYDKKEFKIDETIIAQQTKERIPQLYKNNRIDDSFLNQFLQQQQLKIEDIVQIIDFETRDQIFGEVFFNVNYPINFSNIIYRYDNHKREVNLIQIPLNLIDIENDIQFSSTNIDITLEEFYKNNLDKYMSDEKRNVEYIVVNKSDYTNNFMPTDYEILDYFNNNKDLFFEKEKRSYIQFNFKSSIEANNLKNKITSLNNAIDIINYANENNIEYNSFENISRDEVLDEISNVLFKLQVDQQSDIFETALAKHIIILQDIKPESQLSFDKVQRDIRETITNIEVDNYFTELNNNIAEKIVNGYSLNNIANEFKLKLQQHNLLSKNYSDFSNDQKEFYKSLITNVFASNKDFVNDIVEINSNLFYIFNVTDTEPSIPLDLDEIKETILEDWKIAKKIEITGNKLEKNKINSNYVEELSSLYNLPTKKLEINKSSQNLPKNLIIEIFEGEKGSNKLEFKDNYIYIANIIDIIIPINNRNENLSLMGNLKNSFGNELLKNVKITTNDNLINAVIDRY